MHNKAKTTRGLLFYLVVALLSSTAWSTAQAQSTSLSPSDVKGFAESTFNSPVFSQLQSRFQQQNRSVMQGITDLAVARAKAMLPKAKVIGARLKYGTHNVVSNDGETMIAWMIDATTAPAAERNAILAKIAALADQNVPEALTFEGFVAEYGLFGVQQNAARAEQLYQSAAARNYQPAIYDLAIAAAYGKDGAESPSNALAYLTRAAAIAPDPSYRVCGFGAFLSYRVGNREQALQFAKACWSDLAGIPKALYDSTLNEGQRIGLLRDSISTGIDDGYALLEQVTHQAGAEPQYLECKYMLVNRYRRSVNGNSLRDDAVKCYRSEANPQADRTQELVRYNTVVPGIIGFVPTELRALERARASNHFHYAWSVPYLPFRQQDVDLFAPFVSHTKN